MAMILAVILVFTMVSWYAAKRYYEAQEEQRYQNKVFAIAAGTTVTILTGQLIWAKAKKFQSRVNWNIWLKQEQMPKPRTGLAPKQRAFSAMSD